MLYGVSAILTVDAIARANSSASAVEWSRSEIGSLCVARPAIAGFGIWERPEIALVKILFVKNRVSVGFFTKCSLSKHRCAQAICAYVSACQWDQLLCNSTSP